MATLYRYFIRKGALMRLMAHKISLMLMMSCSEESGERRPLKRRRLSSLDEEKHPPLQSGDWAGLPTDRTS